MAAILGLKKLSLFRHPTKIFVYCTVDIDLSFLHPPLTTQLTDPRPYLLTYLLTYLLSSICELVRKKFLPYQTLHRRLFKGFKRLKTSRRFKKYWIRLNLLLLHIDLPKKGLLHPVQSSQKIHFRSW